MGINCSLLYIKKILFPVLFTLVIYLVYTNLFKDINHKDIATVLVSTNSIVAAFLVLSLTILLTQKIDDLPNTDFSYKKLLINNAEVGVIFVVSSILINLFYMLISTPTLDTQNKYILEYYPYFLSVIGILCIFSTVLVIKITIDDLLLISKATKDAENQRRRDLEAQRRRVERTQE